MEDRVHHGYVEDKLLLAIMTEGSSEAGSEAVNLWIPVQGGNVRGRSRLLCPVDGPPEELAGHTA